MDFDSCPIEDSHPVLQLRKWAPSEFPYNPSNFREGFISPTRKSLLLLSNDSEALLLPLVKGRCASDKGPEITSDETSVSPHESSVPSISGSREIFSSSSESVEFVSHIGHTSGISLPGSSNAFISDVDSLTWGLCGNTCDQHETAPFRELLFVSGKHGVFVHAYSQFDESIEVLKPDQACDVEKGTWVDWGPSTTISPTLEVHEATEDRQSASPKIWMRSFLTKVERLTSGNDVYTRFPERSLLPNNAVISFKILDHDSPFLNSSIPVLGSSINKPDPDLSSSVKKIEDDNSSGGVTSSLYKCIKVFSDNSYQLVGFALTNINPTPVNTSYVDDGTHSRVMVSVARLVSWGLQWVYSVKLDENLDTGPFEWIDFTFSHRFLICLSTSGSISLYGAVTGGYMASLNVASINGLGYSLSSHDVEHDSHDVNEMREKFWHRAGSFISKRRFKRLFVFPQSSLLGVMDESGVIDVIHTDNHVHEDNLSFEGILPSQHHSDLGLLIGWGVGGADVGYQRVLLNTSAPHDISRLAVHGTNSYSNDILPIKENMNMEHSSIKDSRGHRGIYIITSSGPTQTVNEKNFTLSDFPSFLMRKAFLPHSGYSEDDVICCSPFGVTRLIKRYSCEKKWCHVEHANLQLNFIVNDDLNYSMPGWEASSHEAVGCNFNGYLYLVTEKGLSVVLPSISIPSNFFPVEAIGYSLPNSSVSIKCDTSDLMGADGTKKPWSPWKVGVLDRVLLYEDPEVAEKLCVVNGWELRIPRIRRLQLSLDYLELEEIEKSLEMLMGVNLAVEGILRLIFAAVYLMFYKVSSDNEVSAASRLLALATGYATRVIRKYGLVHHKKVAEKPWDSRGNEGAYLMLTEKEHDEEATSRSLQEMAQLLVVIRRLQGKLNAKFKRPGQLPTNTAEDEAKVPAVSDDALLFDISNQREMALPASGTELSSAENLALMPADTVGAQTPDFHNFNKAVLVSEGSAFGKRTFNIENPKDMIARWELDNIDIKTVVKDALLSGRLPLAVLRLHLHHVNSLLPGTETHDTFNDVRIAGRAIAYDLFVKGEIGLGITTLQKLGEDVESSLKQLVFGTIRRSLRVQVAEEMKKYAYLGPHELKILEMLSLVERVYPCNSFFSTLATRQKELKKASNEDALKEISLHLLHPLFNNLKVMCGEIDGVVLGSWTTVDEHSVAPEVNDDSSHAAYWAAAAAWSDAWDQRVIDRDPQSGFLRSLEMCNNSRHD